MKLTISSNTKQELEKAINKYYYSVNYFINSDNEAENIKSGLKSKK
jgi:hypothetical protein